MKGFEELEKLDPLDVYQKTYISVDEFNAIKNKNFEIFNRTKATGLMKILKREYDLDMSDWMEEFEAYKKEHDDEKDIFVVAPKESETGMENKLYVYIALGIVAFFVLLFFLFPSGNSKSENTALENDNYLVDEAKQKLEEKNSTIQNEMTDIPEKEHVTEEKITPPVKKDIFYLSAGSDLWVGIKYLDTNEATDKIFKGRFDLDPTRDQRITLGHGYFKLVLNDQEIEPRVPNIYKITYRNGELDLVKVPIKEPKPEPKEPEPEPDTEAEVSPDTEASDTTQILEPIEE